MAQKRACKLFAIPLSAIKKSAQFQMAENNTNPILDESSPQHAELTRRGIEVAWDGLEIEL